MKQTAELKIFPSKKIMTEQKFVIFCQNNVVLCPLTLFFIGHRLESSQH